MVVIIPDYDGIGPYELWRANLLAQQGYAGLPHFAAIQPLPLLLTKFLCTAAGCFSKH